ncbi:MAG: ATPase, T2SS/T4P/T4SS family, partial [Phycisphaerae bacterium]
MQERLFTIHQVAELLGASPREVLEWIRRDWLVSQQLPDGPVRVSERALVGFLKDRGIDLGQLMTSTAAESDERAIGESGAPRQAPRPETPDAVPVTATQEEAGNDLAIRQMLTGDRALPTAQPDAEEASPAGPVEEPPVAVVAAGPRQAEETQAAQGAQEADMTQEPDITQEAASVSAGEASAVTEAAGDKASQVAGAILADAVAQAASHIHLETPAEGLTLRLRVDGALRDKPNFRRRLPDGLAARLVERLLQWAGVSEVGAARARCGRFSQTIDGREVAFELSAVPTTGGPRLVI